MNTIQILSGIGIFLSIYAYYVGLKARHGKYLALCDISDNISCTKAFTSKYSKMLGVPNALLGIIFYSIIYVLETSRVSSILVWGAILGAVATIFLAYISYFKLKNFCIVCTATYLVNICIFALVLFTKQ